MRYAYGTSPVPHFILRGRNDGTTVPLPVIYEDDGEIRKYYGFVAILGYSRMRFGTFVPCCDTPTLIRCFMEAFEYFGGLTTVALTDRMQSVLLAMVENTPNWNPRFADFMVSIGVGARVCKPHPLRRKARWSAA